MESGKVELWPSREDLSWFCLFTLVSFVVTQRL